MTTQTTQPDKGKTPELESVLKWLDVPGVAVPAPADPEIDGQAEQVVGHLLTVDPKDADALTRGRPYNPAFLHPDDLAALGVAAGDTVRIESDHASILGIAEAAPELRRGVLSMSHAFGDAPERDGEYREIGSTTGRLVDTTVEFDPYTGIPRMSAIPVSVERVESA